MTERKLYGATFGPYLYDDTDAINDPDGDFTNFVEHASVSDGGHICAFVVLLDTDQSHGLTLQWNEDDTGHRTLSLLVAGGNRSLTLNENFTIADGYNVTIQALGQANQFTMNEGFTIGDGYAGTLTYSAVSKTLTVEDTSIVSQDYTADASPTFATVKLTNLSDGKIPKHTSDAVGLEDSILAISGSVLVITGTVACSDLTNGYIPYHVSDAAGLANSPILISSGNAYTTGSLWGFSTDSDSYYGRVSANRLGLYAAGNLGFSMFGAGSLCSFAIGVGAAHGDDLIRIYYAPTNDSDAHGIHLDYIPTYTASNPYTNTGMYFAVAPTIGVGVSNTGSVRGFHPVTYGNAALAGSITGLYNLFSEHGLLGATGTVGNVYGWYLKGYRTSGTISGNFYGLYIDSTNTGGTLSGTEYSIYVANPWYSYFNGYVGIRVAPAVCPLEVEDAATTASMLVKITQDDANVYGLVIGNDTYSTTDTNGLRFQVDNSGNALVTWTAGNFTIGPSGDTDALKLDSNKDFYITAGDMHVEGGSLYLTEIADAQADVATKGQLWVDSDTHALMFTDKDGTDYIVDLTAV